MSRKQSSKNSLSKFSTVSSINSNDIACELSCIKEKEKDNEKEQSKMHSTLKFPEIKKQKQTVKKEPNMLLKISKCVNNKM